MASTLLVLKFWTWTKGWGITVELMFFVLSGFDRITTTIWVGGD